MNPVAYLEAAVIYCDDNLHRLAQFPSDSVDLIYLDPPFFSNRYYEVIWGDEAETRNPPHSPSTAPTPLFELTTNPTPSRPTSDTSTRPADATERERGSRARSTATTPTKAEYAMMSSLTSTPSIRPIRNDSGIPHRSQKPAWKF